MGRSRKPSPGFAKIAENPRKIRENALLALSQKPSKSLKIAALNSNYHGSFP
jgi:hypothetical protein